MTGRERGKITAKESATRCHRPGRSERVAALLPVPPAVSFPVPFSVSPLLVFPFPAATTGRAAALIGPHRALGRRRAPNGYVLPFSSVPAVRNGAPQTLIQAICCRICNILPSSFDFVCKNYLACMCTPISYAGSAPDQVIFFLQRAWSIRPKGCGRSLFSKEIGGSTESHAPR